MDKLTHSAHLYFRGLADWGMGAHRKMALTGKGGKSEAGKTIGKLSILAAQQWQRAMRTARSLHTL